MNLGELFDGCLQIETKSQTADALSGKDGLPTAKGIVLFADNSDGPIQLLICANIRRTATARLFHDDDVLSKRTDISDITRKIYYKSCFNDLANLLEYHLLCHAIYPASYKKLLNLGKRSYVTIDLTAKWPNFCLSDKSYCSGNEQIFGTFPTRRSASDFIELLRNAFMLCYRPGLVNSPQKASSCPYLQMESCPAPCVANMSKASYLAQIKDAISAACGHIDEQAEKLLLTMKQLSENTEFERANAVKKQIEQIERLKHPRYKWTCDLESWKLLHIDKSTRIKVEGKRKKQQTYAAFVIGNGYILQLKPFTLESVEELCNSLTMPNDEHDRPADLKVQNELMSLVSLSLYRSKPAGVWLNCSKGTFPDANQITNAICKRFAVEP